MISHMSHCISYMLHCDILYVPLHDILYVALYDTLLLCTISYSVTNLIFNSALKEGNARIPLTCNLYFLAGFRPSGAGDGQARKNVNGLREDTVEIVM